MTLMIQLRISLSHLILFSDQIAPPLNSREYDMVILGMTYMQLSAPKIEIKWDITILIRLILRRFFEASRLCNVKPIYIFVKNNNY